MTEKNLHKSPSAKRQAPESSQGLGGDVREKGNGGAGFTGRTRNISLTNPHKVPRRHHEAAQAPSSAQSKRAEHPNQPKRAEQKSGLGGQQKSHKKSAKGLQLTSTSRAKAQEPPQMQHAKKGPVGSPRSKPHAFSFATPSSKTRYSKRPFTLPSFLLTSLRSSKRLQIAVTCLVSAVVLIGVLEIVNSCTNAGQTSPSTPATGASNASSQNVMAKKLSGIAHEIGTISQTVNAIQADGYHVGFSTESLEAGATLGYDQNRLFYSASSIKGPYLLAALENRGSIPSAQRDNIEAAIVDSDNDAYFSLVQSFGIDSINAELASVGATDRLNSSDYFVHITPRQLCSLWKISASYVDSHTDDTAWLQTLFAQTINSEIAKLAGAETWSKAGWITDEDESYNATVDAGIVSREKLTYAMAIMCDEGEDFDAIAPLVQSLDALEQYFS